MLNTRKRLASILLAAALTAGGMTAVAAPASAASAAATAFNKCITPYVNGANVVGKGSEDGRQVLLNVGYANCYYDLSQRTDITGQQEIDAINNYNTYLARAQHYIIKVGSKTAIKLLTGQGLKGLRF